METIGVQIVVQSKHMSDEQSNHVAEIGRQFVREMATKYEAGQKEHGGNLWDLSIEQLLDEAVREAIDQVVYLMTLRAKVRGAR